jgi:hypothetical protein
MLPRERDIAFKRRVYSDGHSGRDGQPNGATPAGPLARSYGGIERKWTWIHKRHTPQVGGHGLF